MNFSTKGHLGSSSFEDLTQVIGASVPESAWCITVIIEVRSQVCITSECFVLQTPCPLILSLVEGKMILTVILYCNLKSNYYVVWRHRAEEKILVYMGHSYCVLK